MFKNLHFFEIYFECILIFQEVIFEVPYSELNQLVRLENMDVAWLQMTLIDICGPLFALKVLIFNASSEKKSF